MQKLEYSLSTHGWLLSMVADAGHDACFPKEKLV